MKVDKNMKKLSELVINEIETLAKKKYEMLNCRIDVEKIDRMIENDLQKIAKSLMNHNIHELRPILEKYKNKENEILKRFLSLHGAGQKISDSDHLEQIRYDLIIKAIERAIHLKREYRKQYNSHILEKNFIQGGVFLTGTPHRFTTGEIIELERRGFRPIIYKNDNGALLNSYDTKVLIGLFKLWQTKGMKKTIHFEFKELAEAMVTKPSGGEYRLIYESLKNIAATWVEYKEYFDPNRSKFYSATIQHRPIKSLAWIARTKEEEGGKERAAVVTFHEVLHESLLAENYVFINMVIYNELPTPCARLLYLNILDAISSGITTFEFDRLIDHLTLREEPFNRARAVQTIEASFGHLMEADVITEFTVRRTGRKKTHIDFVPADWLPKPPLINEKRSSLFSIEKTGQLAFLEG